MDTQTTQEYLVRCILSYTAHSETELSVYEGDVLTVTDDSHEGWLYGYSEDEKYGYFPKEYCQRIEELLEDPSLGLRVLTKEEKARKEELMKEAKEVAKGIEKMTKEKKELEKLVEFYNKNNPSGAGTTKQEIDKYERNIKVGSEKRDHILCCVDVITYGEGPAPRKEVLEMELKQTKELLQERLSQRKEVEKIAAKTQDPVQRSQVRKDLDELYAEIHVLKEGKKRIRQYLSDPSFFESVKEEAKKVKEDIVLLEKSPANEIPVQKSPREQTQKAEVSDKELKEFLVSTKKKGNKPLFIFL